MSSISAILFGQLKETNNEPIENDTTNDTNENEEEN